MASDTIDVLAQKFFKFQCDPDLTEKSLAFLKELEYRGNTANQTSVNNRLGRKEEMKELHQWFQQCLNKTQKEMQWECDKLQITQSWANKTGNQEHHHWHHHPNSFASAVFYLNNSECKTVFAIGNIWDFNKNFTGNLNLQPRGQGRGRAVVHEEPTVAGTLLIFPSVVEHSVTPNMEEENERYSISFNTFPVGMIGSLGSLSGLNIQVDM